MGSDMPFLSLECIYAVVLAPDGLRQAFELLGFHWALLRFEVQGGTDVHALGCIEVRLR
jgi:hypothetical protein